MTDLEANLPQLFGVEDHPAVEDECGLVHRAVDILPVNGRELLPLGGDDDSLAVLGGLERRGSDLNNGLNCNTSRSV